VQSALAVLSIVVAVRSTSGAADDARAALQGVWVARLMEVDGKTAPAEATRRMRFTFKGDRLLIRGNFDDNREDACPYTIDPKKSPKHLDFTPPSEKEPVLGIYDLKGDELKVCLRHAGGTGGRPTAFATRAGSNLVLIVFQKQKK
jgi:uncharacterized protein (TIGR03067 family)